MLLGITKFHFRFLLLSHAVPNSYAQRRRSVGGGSSDATDGASSTTGKAASGAAGLRCIFRKCIFRKCIFYKNFANFWRARSRLYRNEILQENMRSTAFFKLYKICILLHRCNLKIFAKNRFEKTAIFREIQNSANFANHYVAKFAKFYQI